MNANALALTGRILLAALFLLSGIGKIFSPEQTIGYIAHAGLPLPSLAYAGAVVAEVGGGFLLAAGYKTRLTGIVLAGFTVAAAVFVHAALGDQNQLVHFMKNFAIVGGLLQVVAFGAGTLSLDARKAPAARVAA